ncbi:unnamed protein product, partial [Rhizoctonia solani]
MLEDLPKTFASDNSTDITLDNLIGFGNHDRRILCAITYSPTRQSHARGRLVYPVSKAEVWSFSSLAFDIITTFSTIAYFFCARKDLNARPGILSIVWQVLWASATPPLILVIISIVDGYLIPGSPGIIGVVAIVMMGKIYVLSLMINVVGQGYIRQRFERRWTPPLHEETWMREPADEACNVDMPMVHITVHTEEIELATATKSISKNIGCEGSVEAELERGITDAISMKG